MEKHERKRASNYTIREKEILISLVQKWIDIIENKKTNAVYNRQKNECWEELAIEYNSMQTSGLRTGAQLKSNYEQMKKMAKRRKAEDKVGILKTGGGSFTPKITTTDEKILDLLKDNYFCIQNKFDSNNDSPWNSIGMPSTSKDDNIISLYEDKEMNESIGSNIPMTLIEQGADQQENNVLVDSVKNSHQIKNQSDKFDKTPLKENEPERKKRKSDINNKQKSENITVKKMEALNLKINILKKMEETEIENLKGKKIDNEIKEIIKEKELLDLKIKKIEYFNLHSSS